VNRIQVLVVGADVEKRTALVDIFEECGLVPMIASNVEEIHQIIERRPMPSVQSDKPPCRHPSCHPTLRLTKFHC
jgi:hypothetical protein